MNFRTRIFLPSTAYTDTQQVQFPQAMLSLTWSRVPTGKRATEALWTLSYKDGDSAKKAAYFISGEDFYKKLSADVVLKLSKPQEVEVVVEKVGVTIIEKSVGGNKDKDKTDDPKPKSSLIADTEFGKVNKQCANTREFASHRIMCCT